MTSPPCSGGSEPTPGSRAFGAAEISGLLVMLGQSADGLRSVVAAVTTARKSPDTIRDDLNRKAPFAAPRVPRIRACNGKTPYGQRARAG